MVAPLHRRQRIAELIAGHSVRTQHELQACLAEEGISVTQATLSRDLRELGVAKTPAGYRLPGETPEPADAAAMLERAVAAEMLTAEPGGQLVVLHTRPGHANALASELDRAVVPEVLGTIAGDDTIFLATRSPGDARTLAERLRRLVRPQV